MASELPYEPPTGGTAPEASGFGGMDQTTDLGPGPAPQLPPAEPPQGVSEDVAKLLTSLAAYEREEFERVVAGAVESLTREWRENMDGLHDPHAVMTKGIIFGAIGVVLALLALVAIGLLFLFGLSLVSRR